jgi:glycolate oxidase
MNEKNFDVLKSLLSSDQTICDSEQLERLGSDETEDFCFPPSIALAPKTTAEVAKIAAYCHQEGIPLTVRGGGTGLSGGALPVHQGVVVLTHLLDSIEIDTDNLQVTVGPGVINQNLRDAVEAVGLFYPPDPSSKGSCFLGGNLAENAGGPRAVKYGVTKDYVLGLEVVLADGKIIQTGARTLKNSTGYNLTQLFIGSEGTLGIITKIHLKLIPKPLHDLLLLLPFENMEDACSAVSDIFKAGITPSALEFMERNAIEWSAQYLGESLSIPTNIQAHLLIELDGRHLEVLYQDAETIAAVCEKYPTGEILMADASHQKEQLWKIRRNVAHAVKANSVYKEEDTVVPRFQMPLLLKTVKEIGKKYGFESVCYGHVGDGNLHVNIIRGNLSDDAWQTTVMKGISELFQAVKEMGGTISGEHGIGYVQKNYLPIVFSETELNLMRSIKQQFDPKGILNPGKIFPDS